MGAALGCMKEDSIQNNNRNTFFRRSSRPPEEEKKSHSTQTNYSSEDESERPQPQPDPEYFDRLTIFLNKLPRKNRLPTALMISIVKTNPRYAPSIISLLLILESDGILVQVGMVAMITQQGEYAKAIWDAIFLLKMQNIKIRRSLLIEIMSDSPNAIPTAHKIIRRYQKSRMDFHFTQIQAEHEEMMAKLAVLFHELQAAEKEKIDLLVQQLADADEKPVLESPRTPLSERKEREEEFEFTFFHSPSQRTTNLPKKEERSLQTTLESNNCTIKNGFS